MSNPIVEKKLKLAAKQTCKLFILIFTIHKINLILRNYHQKTLFKFYNENLKKTIKILLI